jgi:hypothetical protein
MSISPNVPGPQDSYHYENTGTPRWIEVLFGVLFVALAALGFFGYTSQSRLAQELSKAERIRTKRFRCNWDRRIQAWPT